MKDAQKPDHVSLTVLVNRLREGRFVIPDFQREFEWKPWDISELMRSIFLDYFIGSLLLWKGKKENFDSLACEAIYGFQGQGAPEHVVLDGQQRLTAMYYAFMAPDVPAPSRANRFLYFIRVDRFMEEAYDEAFEYDWTRTGEKILENDAEQYGKHRFPLAVVGKGDRAIVRWSQGYENYWKAKQDSALAAGDDAGVTTARQHAENASLFDKHLEGITQQFQISYIELDRDLELDKVCDIFTQINSRGIRLDVFDLINALLKPKGLQLKHLWRQAAHRLDFVDTERMNVYILQVMSILRQTYCSPKYLYYLLPGQEKKVREPDRSLRKEVLVPNVAEFEKRWHEAVDALERTINLLRHPQEFGAISSQYLPCVSILPALAAVQTAARALPANRQLDAQRKLRHWYWASVFTNRYSGSVESTSARDFLDLKTWFDNDAAEPALIGEFKTRFRSLELRRETKRGTSVYNGVFNLLVLRGARDWMTGTVPQYGDLDDHHIVPKGWGKGQALDTSIDTILNRTPLTADTNRNVINDRLPNEYEQVTRGVVPVSVPEQGDARQAFRPARRVAQRHSPQPDRRRSDSEGRRGGASLVQEGPRRMSAGLTRYSAMRDSGVSWLGSVPAHWGVFRAGRLLREVDVRSKTGTETHLSMSQRLGLVPSSEMEERRLVSESHVGAKLCQLDDLVLNRLKAHLGVFARASKPGLVSPDYTVLRPVSPDGTVAFLEYVLKSLPCRAELRMRAKGLVEGFWRLYTDDFYQIKLPVPPIPEQTAIVRFLDHADRRIRSYIRAKQKLIKLLEDQKQAIIHLAVTRGLDPNVGVKSSGVSSLGHVPAHWEVIRFKRRVGFQEGPGIMASDFRETGVPLLRISCLAGDSATLQGCNFLDPETVQRRWSHFAVRSGDYLLSASATQAPRYALSSITHVRSSFPRRSNRANRPRRRTRRSTSRRAAGLPRNEALHGGGAARRESRRPDVRRHVRPRHSDASAHHCRRDRAPSPRVAGPAGLPAADEGRDRRRRAAPQLCVSGHHEPRSIEAIR